MQKHKNKKQLAVLTVVFALVLVTAFVYAAGSGTLVFTGTATYVDAENEAYVQFWKISGSTFPNSDGATDAGESVALSRTAGTGDSSATATIVAGSNTGATNDQERQEVRIDASFYNKEDVLTLYFTTRNVGGKVAELSDVEMSSGTGATGVVIEGDFITYYVDDAELPANTTSDVKIFTINMGASATAGEHSFTVTLPWETKTE